MKRQARKRGFTLVELMVVAVIVAILAAVAIPLMSANKSRAIMTEAEAGLGMLRSSLRTLYAETSAYNKDRNGNAISTGSITNIPGVNVNDLTGRWFNAPAYTLSAVGASTFTVTATGNNSTAPNASDVAGLVVTLDDTGTFTRTGY